nr:L-2-amino-thiazoline-4-carboxylic acid hydrolase [Maliibacterium massiliense]
MAMVTSSREISKEAQALRDGIEDRAWWFQMMVRGCDARGADAESIALEATWEYGRVCAKDYKVEKPVDFVNCLMVGLGVDAFEMEFIEADDDHALLRFHYCPLAAKWEKMGLSKAEISRLCRLARHGDEARMSLFPQFELTFPQLIGEGDGVCDLLVRRR